MSLHYSPSLLRPISHVMSRSKDLIVRWWLVVDIISWFQSVDRYFLFLSVHFQLKTLVVSCNYQKWSFVYQASSVVVRVWRKHEWLSVLNLLRDDYRACVWALRWTYVTEFYQSLKFISCYFQPFWIEASEFWGYWWSFCCDSVLHIVTNWIPHFFRAGKIAKLSQQVGEFVIRWDCGNVMHAFINLSNFASGPILRWLVNKASISEVNEQPVMFQEVDT